MNAQQIILAAKVENCTPHVVINALAGSKWPHALLKHCLRDRNEAITDERRIAPDRAMRLRQREHGFFMAWSGFRSQPLPLP